MIQSDSCPGKPVSRIPRAVAVGAFDGVHLGHQAVVRAVIEAANRLGICSAALTFEPTPRQYFGRDPNAAKRLTPDPERLELLCALGVEQVLVQSFDRNMRKMTPEEFAKEVLVGELDARFVAIGASHTFGAGAAAGPDQMRLLGDQLGFEVQIVPLVSVGGVSVSSTTIREALAEGDMAAVRRMLGRPYLLYGTVVRGRGLGVGLKAPTANLDPPKEKLLPAHGVYAGIARTVNGGTEPQPAAVSVGPSPTFDIDETRVEVHLLDFDGDLYGTQLTVALLERLRSIQEFANRDELAAQIRKDIERVRRITDDLRQ